VFHARELAISGNGRPQCGLPTHKKNSRPVLLLIFYLFFVFIFILSLTNRFSLAFHARGMAIGYMIEPIDETTSEKARNEKDESVRVREESIPCEGVSSFCSSFCSREPIKECGEQEGREGREGSSKK
jgi:hypothetical protein